MAILKFLVDFSRVLNLKLIILQVFLLKLDQNTNI